MQNNPRIGLRVKRVDNQEIKQLNALIKRLPETQYGEFYVQSDEECDFCFTVTLVDEEQVDKTLSQICEFVAEERIEIINA